MRNAGTMGAAARAAITAATKSPTAAPPTTKSPAGRRSRPTRATRTQVNRERPFPPRPVNAHTPHHDTVLTSSAEKPRRRSPACADPFSKALVAPKRARRVQRTFAREASLVPPKAKAHKMKTKDRDVVDEADQRAPGRQLSLRVALAASSAHVVIANLAAVSSRRLSLRPLALLCFALWRSRH